MKLVSLLLFVSACAFAAPVTYTMAFTGGLYHANGQFEPFAPEAGSFTYDPGSGFSNFNVLYDGDIFDLTASANAPTVCISFSNCSTGDPATGFNLLTTYNNWIADENFLGPNVLTILTLSPFGGDAISATGPVFPGFQSCCAPPRTGTFTITATPEPSTLKTFSTTALVLFSFAELRLRKAKRLMGSGCRVFTGEGSALLSVLLQEGRNWRRKL
jgi:hypothetical protein